MHISDWSSDVCSSDQLSAKLVPVAEHGNQVFDFANSFAQVDANELINGDYGASVDAISAQVGAMLEDNRQRAQAAGAALASARDTMQTAVLVVDRKSTRLNSSH